MDILATLYNILGNWNVTDIINNRMFVICFSKKFNNLYNRCIVLIKHILQISYLLYISILQWYTWLFKKLISSMYHHDHTLCAGSRDQSLLSLESDIYTQCTCTWFSAIKCIATLKDASVNNIRNNKVSHFHNLSTKSRSSVLLILTFKSNF